MNGSIAVMGVTQLEREIIEIKQMMPDDLSIPDIMDNLYLRLEIEESEKELAAGKGIGHEEIEKKIDQWLLR